ncbi:hypothetical protein JCM3770_003459 [Rhodotorula araucariae]
MTAIQTRSSASSTPDRPRRERQTRLHEHLRAVKPGSRSSSPGGKKPPTASTSASKTVPTALASSSKARAPEEPETSRASGRPRRRAAAKVVMLEVDSSSEEDRDELDEVEEDDSAEEEQVEQLRSATRSAKKRSPVDSDDDLAPALAGNSAGRNKPAMQTQQASSPSPSPSPSKKRFREPSSLEVERMNEAEVQGRLAREKAELMARLAPLGIVPQNHVLDQALRAMSKSNEQFSVDSFIRTLASLDTNVSPVQRAALPHLSISVPPSAKKVTFSTLESPSTPSSIASPPSRFPSPPQSTVASAFPHTHGVATPSQFYTSPPGSAASRAHLPLPPKRPGQHLNPITRSFSAPIIPTLRSVPVAPLPLPTPKLAASTSSNSLFGAAVGMGRVATRRGNLGGPGSAQRQRQQQATVAPSPTRASFSSPAPPAAIVGGPLSNSPLPAFALGAAAATGKPVHPGLSTASTTPPGAPNRLSKLQSWLAEDDEGTSEDEEDKRPGAAAGAEAMFKAAAATSKVAAAVPAPPMQLVDAPPSDEEPEEEVQIRVGGKSVQVLRQRRHADTEQHQQQQALADAQGMTTRASTRASAKGKGRAVLECLCGVPADGQSAAVQCVECDVAFHLACLNAVSVKQLASPWTCSRCVVAEEQQPAHAQAGPDSGRATPQLVNRRVRIGTNTIPHVYREPTFVASTPVSAPRGNNFSHCADMALAPSPTASPVRRFASTVAPTSPVPSVAKLPIPVTPKFGEATVVRAPGDYSPTSPQNYRMRAGRTRMISGGAFLSGEWLNSWDAPTADGDEPPQPASTPVSGGLSSLVDDEWHLPAWSDVTMTPSRALSSATPGGTSSASSSVWDTPFAHASPHAHLRRSSSTFAPSTMPFRTPSQDFLAALDRDAPAGGMQHHTAPAQQFAQRLFGYEQQPHHAHPHSLPHHQQLSYHHHPQQQYYPAPLDLSSPNRPPSPLNPRRMPPHHAHQRKPSLGDGLANPWLGGAVAHERMALSASMKPSHSAPGGGRFAASSMMPTAASVEQQMLDDLLV